MCTVVQRFPVTDFRSDHPFTNMAEGTEASSSSSTSIPARPGMLLKEPSKEDLEVAQSLYEHSQAARTNLTPMPQYVRASQSPRAEGNSPRSVSSVPEPNLEAGGSDGEQSVIARSVAGSDTTPSGQVCR
jgi:hypothetical protein